jgi:myo-inositol-1(or 4)-monophosphatase
VPDLDALLKLAVEAAEGAGVLLQAGLHEARTAIDHKSSVTDMVTEMDRAAEAFVVSTVRAARPDDGLLGEEGADRAGTSGVRWIIDPLDGTTNYAHGYPFFCCSVALTLDGAPVAGAVYDCIKEELFTAERGGGAHLNGRRLQVSDRRDLLRSLLTTGFPYDMRLDLTAALRLFNKFMGVARAIRRDGAAALDLSYVAAGRADGFWEERLHPWDVMAGALLITEAGGVISRFDGSPLSLKADQVVAANPALHALMLDVLADRKR